MMSCLDGMIVYTDEERIDLLDMLPALQVSTAANALYPRRLLSPATNADNIYANILWMGRLVPEKRPMLAIQAFASVVDRLPAQTRLIIIGDGSEFKECVEVAARSAVDHRVTFVGETFDEQVIKQHASTCLFALSSGYVGLSATQALGFGLPVLYSSEEHHAPELTALSEENSIAYQPSSPDACAASMLRFFGEAELWSAKRSDISSKIYRHYSVERMIEPFVRLADSDE